MSNIAAIFLKQIKDTLKNKTVLIQFLMFPLITLVMQNTIKLDNMPENFFVNLFSVMYIGMAPLTSTAAIISEEKETGTLRSLMMSNVSPIQYLVATGGYVFLLCIGGCAILCAAGGYTGSCAAVFMALCAFGTLVSVFLGAAIGVFSTGQMMATSITVPVMLVLSFLPMLSMFNSTIEKIARFFYSQQISTLINKIGDFSLNLESMVIMAANIIITLILFLTAYKKRGLV
ncbi:MAG: ABC transporter permease [Clostridia bacterium]|nr:ABC transporter permease [Clostridia bacterium]